MNFALTMNFIQGHKKQNFESDVFIACSKLFSKVYLAWLTWKLMIIKIYGVARQHCSFFVLIFFFNVRSTHMQCKLDSAVSRDSPIVSTQWSNKFLRNKKHLKISDDPEDKLTFINSSNTARRRAKNSQR